ncbi:MAG TPA: hypothetical protein VFJ96_15130 [Gemmatimonadaceae bacterium]|jgi:hypothetical protein|nr:hypothetical protein [Gemmatimonadaceae bacterium]
MAVLIAGLAAQQAAAQCRPPANSNEAKLLAFYEDPLAFSLATQPEIVPAGSVRIGAELSPIPTPDPSLEQTSDCFTSKTEHTRLAPVFARPRVSVGLPAGFVVEASYLPPVTIADAQPDLGSMALSRSQLLPIRPAGVPLLLTLRAHATIGRVRGSITCAASSLQLSDPNQPCYGANPSRDTFKPNMFGAEGALGTSVDHGVIGLYAGGGVTWLRPRFQVGFTDGQGIRDNTQILVNLTRATAFGGLTWHLPHALDLSGQVYAVPADVVTWRLGAGWRIR